MFIKDFSVMCNHEEYLTPENIALALLHQITLKSHQDDVVFCVKENTSKEKAKLNDAFKV